ncbi:hypothetical protein ACQB60_12985 [Actinomycetota bacterium Odt1-20B]
MPESHLAARLLPWTTADGRPCFLSGDGSGYLSRVTDNVESVQLGIGASLLGHAADLLDDPKASAGELRYVTARLAEALRDALRVAESRGARLPVPGDVLDGLDAVGTDDEGGDGGGPQLPAEAFR